MRKFLTSACAAVAAFVCSAGALLAQESNTPTFSIPTGFTSLDWSSLITSMTSVLLAIIVPVISLAAGVYVVRWGWRIFKGTSR